MITAVAVGIAGITATALFAGLYWFEKEDNKINIANAAKFETALGASQKTIAAMEEEAKIDAEEMKGLNNDLKAAAQQINANQARILDFQRRADFKIHTNPLEAGKEASDIAASGLCLLYEAGGGDVQANEVCAASGAIIGRAPGSVPTGDAELRSGVGDNEG
ncbi:MAG: hypothetical protein KAI73_10645 [Rhodospirillaceae bacterium]|nr:hypothetical protein [Rhodospirillaceae bacterium]